MRLRHFHQAIRTAAFALAFCLSGQLASAQVLECIHKHYRGDSLAVDRKKTAELIREVASSLGLASEIAPIPCAEFSKKAVAWYQPEPSAPVSPSTSVPEGLDEDEEEDAYDAPVPPGNYVVYSVEWVREVIGSDDIQAVALFGHEVGHFLLNHLGSGNMQITSAMETESDRLAGCAVARAGGEWAKVEDLLSRLRSEDGEDNYPDRLTSLTAAKAGYRECNVAGSKLSGGVSDLSANPVSREVLAAANYVPENFDPVELVRPVLTAFRTCGPPEAYQILTFPMFEIVRFQTNGYGCYPDMISAGSILEIELIDTQQRLMGPLFVFRVIHEKGPVDWLVGYDTRLKKIDFMQWRAVVE